MKPTVNTAGLALKVNDASIEQEIAALDDLDHDALKARWLALRGVDPPKGLSRPLLARALAHAMQEKALGGLSVTVRRRLQRLGAELQATGRIASVGTQSMFKPGTRLIREWQRRTHEVTVLENGFQWNGETYRSLSAIARAITGTRWNGHVFFGLKSRQSPESKTCSAGDHIAADACKASTATHQRDGIDG